MERRMSPLCANGTPNQAGRATAASRSRLASKAKSRIIALAALALVAGLIVGRPAPSAADVTPAGAQATIQDLCGTPLPGQARCLSERRVSPTTHRAATMGLSPASTPGGLGPADLADAY